MPQGGGRPKACKGKGSPKGPGAPAKQQAEQRVLVSEGPRFPAAPPDASAAPVPCGFAEGGGMVAGKAEGPSKGPCKGPKTGRGSCIGADRRHIPRAKMTTRCLWNACKALSLGLVLLALGCAMATLGYYADQLSESRQIEGNTTMRIKDEWAGFHLNNLSYAGPIVMGIGGFIVVAACVMTFEARDSAAKVVPARFRPQRPGSPRARKNNVTPAGILPHGVSGSRRSAASQTNLEEKDSTAHEGPKRALSSPRRQSSPHDKAAGPSSGPHHNHQQLLQLLARRRREELTSDLVHFSKRSPGALLKRTPSAPSALHRLHRPPHAPRPPEALLPPSPRQTDDHTKVARSWSRGSRKQSPLSASRRQNHRPVLRRQAFSVDQGTRVAREGTSAPFATTVVHDYHLPEHQDSDEESGGASNRRMATVICHHESYSPLMGDAPRAPDRGPPSPPAEAPSDTVGGAVEVLIEPSSLETEGPLLGAVVGTTSPEFTDLDVVGPYPEVPPPPPDEGPKPRVLLGQRARSETARRHLLTRQKKVSSEGNG